MMGPGKNMIIALRLQVELPSVEKVKVKKAFSHEITRTIGFVMLDKAFLRSMGI